MSIENWSNHSLIEVYSHDNVDTIISADDGQALIENLMSALLDAGPSLDAADLDKFLAPKGLLTRKTWSPTIVNALESYCLQHPTSGKVRHNIRLTHDWQSYIGFPLQQ